MAGLAAVFALSTVSVAPSNDIELQVMAAAPEEESQLDTGEVPLLPENFAQEEDSLEINSSLESVSSEKISASGSQTESSILAEQSAETSVSKEEPSETAVPTVEESYSANTGKPQTGGSYTASSSNPVSSKPASSSSAVSSKPASSSSASTVKPPESSSQKPESSAPTGGKNLRVSLGGVVTEGSAYDILCQIVEAEIGGSYHTETLKAQTVAAYSYILYENAAGRTPSLPARTPTQKTKDAVESVLGQALYYNGKVAFTPYHASSTGYTNPSSEVWSGSYPYLTRVSSAYDPASYCKNQKVTMAASTVKVKVENYLHITLGDDPNAWFSDFITNDGGYVTRFTVTDSSGGKHSLTGRQMRENVLGYAIRSHAFTIAVSGDQITFTTNGYGHGVGMSQTGANAYAVNDGWTYQQILSHYYPGTTLQ